MYYELNFYGSAMEPKFPRHRKLHRTLASVQNTVDRIGAMLDRHGVSVNVSHSPQVYAVNKKTGKTTRIGCSYPTGR